MSSRSSSFDDLTDLGFLKIGATSTFEDVDLNLKIAKLEATNQKLVEEMDRMREELEKKKMEVAAIPLSTRDFLGHWELQNPTPHVPSNVPRKILITSEGSKVVERNNGSIDRKYVCGDADGEFTWIDGKGNRTFYSQSQDKLITESIYESGELNYYLKRSIEKDSLKVEIIVREDRYEFIYRKMVL